MSQLYGGKEKEEENKGKKGLKIEREKKVFFNALQSIKIQLFLEHIRVLFGTGT